MKLMTMSESTKKKPRGGMIKRFKERIQGRRTSSLIQLQTQAISREIEIKVEWSLHSDNQYTLWSSDTER